MIKIFFTSFCLLTVILFTTDIEVSGQNMLGYTDPQGNFYVNDGGKIIHLEHQTIISLQATENSIAYVTNTGNLMYYSNHEVKKLDISNPVFYKNTDHYLYYSLGGSFSVYNGKERKFLGYIQQSPYAFGDSIAAFHDYSDYFYAFYENRFIELEKNAAKKVVAGKNIIAYINHIDQFKIFYDNKKTDVDDYIPVNIAMGANTAVFIDSYNYLKIFYKGTIHELYNLTEINCLEIPGGINDDNIYEYCNGEVVVDVETSLPLYQAGDGLVAYIDDNDNFLVFYEGKFVSLENQTPKTYSVIDNVLWYIDNNNYFKVFCNGELSVVETFHPEYIKADKNVVVYTDLDKRLKAFSLGETISISNNIVLSFEVNNSLIMYNEIANKYKFYTLNLQ